MPYARPNKQSDADKLLSALEDTRAGRQRVDYLAEDAGISSTNAVKAAAAMLQAGVIEIHGSATEIKPQTWIKKGSVISNVNDMQTGQFEDLVAKSRGYSGSIPESARTSLTQKQNNFEILIGRKPKVWDRFKQSAKHSHYGDYTTTLEGAYKNQFGDEFKTSADRNLGKMIDEMCRQLGNPRGCNPGMEYVVAKLQQEGVWTN